VNESWIKLHSKFLNWGWYKNKNTKILFIHCLLKANWQDRYFEGLLIQRGSFVTSYKTLSEELDMTIQEIRTAIKHLISTGELTQKQHTKFSIISIKNYELYQAISTFSNKQATGEQQQYKNIDSYYSTYINNIEKNFHRSLGDIEKEAVKKWIEETDDVRKIKYAINETIMNGKTNLKYTEGILKNIKNKSYDELFTKEENDELEEIFDYDWLGEE
jgi:DnaD/phage-associated family protein